MPNYVKNVVKFKNLKPKDTHIILDMLTTPIMDEDFKDVVLEFAIDFDKIIPEPRRECDCPEDCKVNKDSHIVEDKDRPWFDWYAWHNKYWGTKWNACNCSSQVGKSYVILVFETAWNTPLPIINSLTLLGYDFEVKYADEDFGNNCGKLTYSRDAYFTSIVEKDLPNPYKFARDLWAKY